MAFSDSESVSTGFGVREIRELEAFIPLLSSFLRFLALTQNRGEPNHSYKLLNTAMQQNQPTEPTNH